MSSTYPPITTPTMIPPSDPCSDGYMSGRSEVLWNLPNTYQDVLSVIGSYQNLTWSGNPPDTVTLNGTDNTVGTARVYNTAGAHVIETILVYQKPVDGPYVEIHSVAPLTVPSAGNVSFYAAFDGTTVTPICGGRATAWNFTANFCATNVSVGMSVLDMLHTNDVMTECKQNIYSDGYGDGNDVHGGDRNTVQYGSPGDDEFG
ncbi:hypothetical protein K490DRAFT_56090 [Saccharata proteae CBS 121410]|uniref:Uncharacterized protein n=1 Tax=Saccharata proteae CBS 121410 TaxID=1314787 RepID=A0A9P4LXU1_9PEZI|nr:hypothetical protein K490DRAFT_56090 [Saccharata proteae CBS 121410]